MPGSLSYSEKLELAQLLEERDYLKARKKLLTYYPDHGPLRRELYLKHMEFFQAGLDYRERCAMAANRVGKTEGMGGYETTLHLTGLYPDWWEGRRFDHPVRAWAAGKTSETTRDIIQAKLIGDKKAPGTGLIPGDCIGRMTPKSGIPDGIDTVRVKHVPTGGWSLLGFKSYKQGRSGFEGTEQDVIWLDEEPPLAVYGECLIRTMTTNGIIMLTFTPLEGISDVVLSFLPTAGFSEDDI